MNLDLLKYAEENGMLDISSITKQVEQMKRKELLERHQYSVWQGKDGRWYTRFSDKDKGRVLKSRKTKEEIEKLIIEKIREDDENPTIREVFQEWNDRRLSLNKIGRSSYDRYNQTFERHYCEFGKKKIKSVTSEMIADFLEEELAEKKLSAKAFSGLKLITKGFLKRAKKLKLTSINITELFEELDVSDHDFQKKIKEDNKEVFDVVETSNVIKYLESNLDINNIGILLMFVTGVRVGELVALKYSDFDFSSNCFNVRRTETRYRTDEIGKDGKYVWSYVVKEFPKSDAGVRTVIVPSDYKWLMDLIRLGCNGKEYIFEKNGKRMTTNAIRRRMPRVCRNAMAINKSPHKVRKTYYTILRDSNIDSNLIMKQMGHADVLVGERHYHRDRKVLDEKRRILDSVAEFQIG